MKGERGGRYYASRSQIHVSSSLRGRGAHDAYRTVVTPVRKLLGLGGAHERGTAKSERRHEGQESIPARGGCREVCRYVLTWRGLKVEHWIGG
jgi:hypothetical protein